MAKARQFTVPCENRPGTLAHIAKVLGDAKVNILALLTTTAGKQGSVQLVADKPGKVKKALEAAGLRYTEKPVLHVQLPNVPGALGRFAGKLAEQGHQHHIWLSDGRERVQEGKCGALSLRFGHGGSHSIATREEYRLCQRGS